jgi:NAD+ diphosphatase
MSPNPNHFANYPLDRAAIRRKDDTWLAEARLRDDARLAIFHKLTPFIIDEGTSVGWLGGHAASLFGASPLALFLGVNAQGAPTFAMEAPDDFDMGQFPLAELGDFVDLRGTAGNLPTGDLAVLGCAKWLFDWHRRHGFCANCGARSEVKDAGWRRLCPKCSTEHFPRVDPVVIMAPTLDDRVCLGRQHRWPRGMYSALAGFIEPGESIEDAVAREVLEEAGLTVTHVRYHSTQPWPFPASLMFGVICTVENDAVTVDGEELEEARWFTRDEVKQMLARTHADAAMPGAIAIAHHIIKAWAIEE